MRYFHSRKDGNGNMLVGRLQRYNSEERQDGCVWVNIAKQDGKGFNWDKKTTVKLGFNDLVRLWPRLKVKAPKISLYHEWGDNKKSIIFNRHVVEDENKKRRAAYYININRDTSFHLGWGEAEVFCEFLRYALVRVTDFDREVSRGRSSQSQEEEDEDASVSSDQVGVSSIEDEASEEGDDVDDQDVEDDLDW